MFVEHKEAGEVKELDAANKLLLRAAVVLAEKGWCQYDLGAPHKGFCMLGALKYADGKSMLEGFSRDGQKAFCLLDDLLGNIAHWNNAPSRTKDEVIAKLRAVAFSS